MKKLYFRRIAAALIAVSVAFGMMNVGISTANAEDSWKLKNNGVYFLGMTEDFIEVANQRNSKQSAELLSVKSSDPKVVEVRKIEGYDDKTNKEVLSFGISFKKIGKSTLTVNYKNADGTIGTVAKTIKIKKYPNQIKKLKVNGKRVKTTKKKTRYGYNVGYCKQNKVNIKMALKKGWKVKSVSATAWNLRNFKEQNIKVKKSAVTKGTAIKFPKGYECLSVDIVMAKGTEKIDYHVFFSRNRIK